MLQPRTVLQNFEILRPKYELDQTEILRWLGNAHAQVEAWKNPTPNQTAESFIRLFQRFGCSPNRIGKRGIELPDCIESSISQMTILSPSHSSDIQTGAIRGMPGAGFSVRTQFFDQVTHARVQQLFENEDIPPQHLIHVTCTGYSSPSSVQALVSKRRWTQHCCVTHAYHMGCYASLPAVRIADGYRATGLEKIDIVHTELCSLHLNLADHSPEQMIVQSLFADGYIRYSAVNATNTDLGGLELITIHEEILPDSKDLMTWQASEWGMKMTLSRDVPLKLSTAISKFIARMLLKVENGELPLLSDAVFAIHPGGPRIIDQLQTELNLREEQVSHSKNILFKYGNMSSATLPYIWHSLVGDSSIPTGKWILSLAFGPGLTAFGSLMRKR